MPGTHQWPLPSPFPRTLPCVSALVLFYQAVGRADNGLGGTVILLQLEDLRIGIYFRKIENIVNIGTTEGVDTLCIIPHHTDMLMVLGKLQHDAVLCKIGILILIHQNVTELVLITRQHLGVVPEQQECVEQQIVEVHRICCRQRSQYLW